LILIGALERVFKMLVACFKILLRWILVVFLCF